MGKDNKEDVECSLIVNKRQRMPIYVGYRLAQVKGVGGWFRRDLITPYNPLPLASPITCMGERF